MISTLPRTTRTLEPATPAFRLLRNTSRSFTLIAGKWEHLAEWLIHQHQFRYAPICDEKRELCRLWDAHRTQLLIVYTGPRPSVLCQGSHALLLASLLSLYLAAEPVGDLFDYHGDLVESEVR